MRIVSLLPSATEILCHIGGRSLLVGRSHECDFPPGLDDLPVLTGQRVLAADPRAIDAAVRAQLAGGSSLYTVLADRLGALAPDLILTQDLCSVCSIDRAAVDRIAAGMNPQPRILSLNPDTIDAVLDDVLRVGRAVGLEPAAQRAVVALRDRMYRAGDFANPYDDGPSVAFLEWTDPLYVGGHWTPQLIERAGGRHPLNPTVALEGSGAAVGPQMAYRKAGKSVSVPPEALIASNPDVLIICPCGRSLDQARADAGALARQPWWGELAAVRAGRVAIVDGNQMFNRPGPRLVDAYEWLVGWLNDRPMLMPREFPWHLMA